MNTSSQSEMMRFVITLLDIYPKSKFVDAQADGKGGGKVAHGEAASGIADDDDADAEYDVDARGDGAEVMLPRR